MIANIKITLVGLVLSVWPLGAGAQIKSGKGGARIIMQQGVFPRKVVVKGYKYGDGRPSGFIISLYCLFSPKFGFTLDDASKYTGFKNYGGTTVVTSGFKGLPSSLVQISSKMDEVGEVIDANTACPTKDSNGTLPWMPQYVVDTPIFPFSTANVAALLGTLSLRVPYARFDNGEVSSSGQNINIVEYIGFTDRKSSLQLAIGMALFNSNGFPLDYVGLPASGGAAVVFPAGSASLSGRAKAYGVAVEGASRARTLTFSELKKFVFELTPTLLRQAIETARLQPGMRALSLDPADYSVANFTLDSELEVGSGKPNAFGFSEVDMMLLEIPSVVSSLAKLSRFGVR